MRDIYHETIDRAFSALAYAEGMYEILGNAANLLI